MLQDTSYGSRQTVICQEINDGDKKIGSIHCYLETGRGAYVASLSTF